MNPALAKFMAKFGGHLEGLMGKAIPEIGSDVARVGGWAKGSGQREAIGGMVNKFDELPELLKMAIGGGISGAAGVGVGKALGGSADERYQKILDELEKQKKRNHR